MPLKLYNTLARAKEKFKPLSDKKVGLYTCGPTVYNYAHIGNLRTYIFEDILKRVLLYNDFKVRHVMNITDVGHLVSDADNGEDKMEIGARREKKTAWEIAKFYTKAFKSDIEQLNILPPDIWSKATDHITEQIEMIKVLEKKGVTYQTADGVYFDTSKDPDYGKLAKLDIEGLQAGARVKMTEGKRNLTDFALWKFSPADEKRQMEWDSPWGKGFPGWHIECSAMAMKYLGDEIDIHCGAVDHLNVHHTNEIAQSEAATGKQFVRYWVHGEHLLVDNGKMSKSKGNFAVLATLVERGFDPLAFRYLVLTSHYRSKLNFTWESLAAAQNALEKLRRQLGGLDDGSTKPDKKYLEKFTTVINDDMDTPQAISLVWEVLKSDLGGNIKKVTLLEFDRVLGLELDKTKKGLDLPEIIEKLLTERKQARTDKNWQRSDKLRDQIAAEGYIVEDTPGGQEVSEK